MHLPSHLVLSWLVGHALEDRRDRVLIAWAGVLPDLDALSALGGIELYGKWHHVLTHGVFAAVAGGILVAAVARRKVAAALLAVTAFHLHIVCDLLGSGPEWPIVYLYPLSDHETFTPYGWTLGSWQNILITALAFAATAAIGVKRGRTFAEAWLPAKADAAVVEVLRRRFG